MVTWEPRIWKVVPRRLTEAERQALAETERRLADALGIARCSCGSPVDTGIAGGVRCRGCWGKQA